LTFEDWKTEDLDHPFNQNHPSTMSEKKKKKSKKRSRDAEDSSSSKKAKVESPSSSSSSAAPAPTITLSPIASPLAGESLTKKLLKLVKRASKVKTALKRGVKEVVKCARKDQPGLCIIAGDISPIDVITHLPILCEEKRIAYCYVTSKAALGAAAQTKRPTSCVMITPPKDFEHQSSYDELRAAVNAIMPKWD
jgi:H/ACA ribonucleoprotein complex subunit 2